ncbi:MAG: 26S protease regulatory subunit [Chloroflexi bacterium]|nr:26S protease regulatory subunit [Chloroflexota bacterium]
MREQDPLDVSAFGAAFKRFVDNMNATAARETNPLLERLKQYLGDEPDHVPIVAEEFESYEHPNAQVALEAVLAKRDRRYELVGVAAQNKRWGAITFSDLLSGSGPTGRISEGSVDYVNFRLEDDNVLACVQFGLYLVTDGDERFAIWVGGPPQAEMGPRTRMRVEIASPRREAAAELLKEITAAMSERNVYRGKAISLAPGQYGVQALIKFHRLRNVERDDIVFPPGVLDRIERQSVEFTTHAEALTAGGRSLKRGILLYGPPGTGKTLTVMYLASRMPGRTHIIMTGHGLGAVGNVGHFAKMLAPTTVIIEDVDLIAQERGFPGMQTQPLLFELLNQMDGIADDADILYVLTTNRPDILEPALAARPGRIDLAVELPMPDADGRRRLLQLYARGLRLKGVDLDRYVERTAGASPAYIKEMLRRAALLAAIAGAPNVGHEHLDSAMTELEAGGELAKRIVGFGTAAYLPPSPSVGPMRPAGFPSATVETIEVKRPS